MRAELRDILPNNNRMDWQEFAAVTRSHPRDGHGWFILDIGAVGERGTEMFQAHVSTPAAASRARSDGDRQFHGFVVDSFEPEVIVQSLTEFVNSVNGPDWKSIVEQLRRRMHWEYEGMSPITDHH